MPDAVVAILRLIHIVAGILWVGFGVFNMFFFAPTIRRLQADGGKFAHTLYQHTPFVGIMSALPLITGLVGLALYDHISDHFNIDWMKTSTGVVWTIGSVAGLLAMGHATAVLGPIVRRQKEILKQIYENDGPPDRELLLELGQLGAKMGKNATITMGMIVVSVFCMATARYF